VALEFEDEVIGPRRLLIKLTIDDISILPPPPLPLDVGELEVEEVEVEDVGLGEVDEGVETGELGGVVG